MALKATDYSRKTRKADSKKVRRAADKKEIKDGKEG